MANLTSTQDLKKAVLAHCGELTSGTSPFDARATEYLNRMYQEVISGGTTFMPDMGEPFEWAKAQAPGVVILLAPYETGTVSLTNGSTSGTFSAGPTLSQAGRWLKVTDRPEYFRIATHTAAATAFTLDANYTDTTGAALTFKSHKLDYALTGTMQRLIEPMRVYRAQAGQDAGEGKIYGTSPSELSRQFPLITLQAGTPSRFAVVAEANGAFTVRFNTSVATDTRAEYEYIPVQTDLVDTTGDIPVVPREDRIVLVYGATYFLMLDKNDSRSDMFFRMTQSKLQAMMASRRKGLINSSKGFGRLYARQGQLESSSLRTASGIGIE